MSRTTRFSKLGRAFGLLLLVFAVIPNGPAFAQSKLLDGPRASGVVGESFDGFAVARDGSGGAERQLVDQVNAERRKVYQDVAAKEGTNVDAVGRIYAQQIISNAPAGTWVQDGNGNWARK